MNTLEKTKLFMHIKLCLDSDILTKNQALNSVIDYVEAEERGKKDECNRKTR